MTQQVLINLKEHSICISFGSSNPLYYFDKAGRLIGAYVAGRNFKRSLDDRLHQQWGVWQDGVRRRRRRIISGNEKVAFFENMSQAIALGYYALLEGRDNDVHITSMRKTKPQRAETIRWLKKILAFDETARKREAATFHSIYKPVGILPPDQYLSIVLQATEGCAYNQCSFCDFYKHTKFHIKSETEFRAHIESVKAFFRESIRLRKSIFLADANALMIPQNHLLQVFEQVNHAFDILPSKRGIDKVDWKTKHPIHFTGIYAFIDAFSTRKRSTFDFATLRRWNLKRVYIGVETGNGELLRFLRKPGTPALIHEAVETIKAGGVHVGVILLIGVGGEDYFDAHVKDSCALINEMDLSSGDIIYLSEFVEHAGLAYSQRVAEAGIKPLTQKRMQAQMQAMKAGFRFSGKQGGPQVSIYDIREFSY